MNDDWGSHFVEEDHAMWHRLNPEATSHEHHAFLRRMGISVWEDAMWHARTDSAETERVFAEVS